MKKEVITKINPKSPISEIFRILRTNMQYINKKNGPQTMVVTSTVQGEGKSFVVANMAVTFAQANKRVVLIDADMRRPRQHTIFDVNIYPGLSNYLSGIDAVKNTYDIDIKNCIYETKIENLYLMPAGNIPPNPSELLQSDRLPQMIDELKRVFDVIIFDGAPCLLVTDATLISRIVDSTILVTSQGKTKVDELKDAKRRVESIGGHVIGVVLNKVKVSNKQYENKYYYANNSYQLKKISVDSANAKENENKEEINKVFDKPKSIEKKVSDTKSIIDEINNYDDEEN